MTIAVAKKTSLKFLICSSLLLVHLFAVANLLAATAVRHEEPAKPSRIIVADDASYAPFAFLDADGKPAGITIDIWKLWSSKTGIPVEFQLTQWNEALDAVLTGKADAIGGLFKTEERQQKFDFTHSFFTISTSVFFHQQIHGIRGIEDLHGFPIGVVGGDSAEELIRQYHPKTLLMPYPGMEDLIKAAVSGEVKVFVADSEVARFYLAKHDQQGIIRESTQPVAANALHAAVTKGNLATLAAIQDGFNRITAKEIEGILAFWTGRSLLQRIPWPQVWFSIGIVLAGVVLILCWNIQLRRTVRKILQDAEHRNQQLRESEERFSKAFASSPAPMVISDIQSGRFIDVNDQWLRMLEYSREETIGRTSYEQGIWEDPQTRTSLGKKIRECGSFRDEPVRFVTKSGAIRDTLWSAETINLSGQPAMLSLIFDYTERKKIEDALRESESYNKVIFHDSHVPLAVIDPATSRFIDGNQATLRLYGLAHRDELQGKHPADLSVPVQYDGRPSAQAAAERIRQALQQGSVFFEWHHQRPNGDVWDGEVQLMTFCHGGRQLIQLSLQDITRRKQAEREQEKLHQQLMQSQKMESVGRLAGGVAHDFNNMLSVILGHTEMALIATSPDHPILDHLKNIQEAAQRSADLTRQLLAFARKQTVAPRVLDVNTTVAGMLNMLERLIGEDIALQWQPCTDPVPIRMDPSQIDQVLVNLCVNSRDAIAGTGTITIATASATLDQAFCAAHPGASPGEFITLTVHDNGSGMSPETLAHLFEPFFTTKEVGIGTGLGLATVYGIVKQNNGFIAVDSTPGRGTTFQIYFPRIGDAIENVQEHLLPASAALGRETILLVEDGAMMLDITSAMLTQLGYTVLAANSPGEAHQLASDNAGDIHLLITDVIMPTMNGRELATSLQRLYPGIKCLFMSGYTADVIAHHGVLEEGVHFLAKPFTINDLATKVREALATALSPDH